MDISVVVPLYNEEESLPELVAWIDRVAQENKLSFEVIMVDDGSSDNSWAVVEQLKERYPTIKGIRFARNYGKSAALYCGFDDHRILEFASAAAACNLAAADSVSGMRSRAEIEAMEKQYPRRETI